ncbi:MAG TPA: hypothetical protein VK752_07200 [Bryobacteraceae bacterium]|jgi:hypothetical protein|nr:hypothetical protein [Bryobacteraceae bacterium]
MKTFATAREAKEFLVSKIVTEAARENVPLSEVETKMLYFSETAWTLPDIGEVNDAFDREYDMAEYEQKIMSLVRKFRAHARAENREELQTWAEAVRTLGKEDHYLQVMVGGAGVSVRPRGDLLKLLATALLIVGVFVAFALLATRR